LPLSPQDVLKAVAGLCAQPNVESLTPEELKRRAEPFGARTQWGSCNFVSAVKNRSAGLTVYIGSEAVRQRVLSARQREILDNWQETVAAVLRYVRRAPLVCVERTMGQNGDFRPRCVLTVSVHRPEMCRLSHMVCQTLFEAQPEGSPVQHLVYVPEWPEMHRQMLVLPEVNVTFVLGSDYYGEAKKGFLRMAMWNAKQRGMLGLHAGSKTVRAVDMRTGKMQEIAMLFFGLTATGKTTHSCHDHGLNLPGERTAIAQDDVVFLSPDGATLGTERGFYLKTEGLEPNSQPLIYRAATSANTIFENVLVDYQGNVDFNDTTLTGNGRGVMQRDDFGEYKSESINTPPASEVDRCLFVFIVRRNAVVPLLAKLTPEQLAAAFMLGESVESSGGDPRRAGQTINEVGTNPFIVGSEVAEGNRFYEMVKANGASMQGYLLNTGGVGEIVRERPEGDREVVRPALHPSVNESAALLRAVLRNTIEWEREADFGYLVPANEIEGIDLAAYNPRRFYSEEERQRLVDHTKRDRLAWLEQFQSLEPGIVESAK
jgi:phosphoenolpyruvate carboxykinase (ATP)